jgi:hypothetical protein
MSATSVNSYAAKKIKVGRKNMMFFRPTFLVHLLVSTVAIRSLCLQKILSTITAYTQYEPFPAFLKHLNNWLLKFDPMLFLLSPTLRIGNHW